MAPPIHTDFRSDTVTQPTAAMKAAMLAAPLGDDVYGEDPTVNHLEAAVAERLGKQAGLFVPSGTQANLIGILVQCGRGDEYLCGQQAHCYRWEGGGAAVLGSVQPQPLEHAADGSLPLSDIEAAVKPDDPHYARTRLLALENTIGGRVIGLDYLQQASALARRLGLAVHLDGARLFNAAVALGVPAATVAAPFDTVSVCLSKGLGAPVGSVLVGPAALIQEGRRLRKALGGGMRQAGVLAAAGLYALEHHVERLAEDHARARRLAQGLMRFGALTVTPPATNMVWVDVERDRAHAFADHLAAWGIGVSVGHYGTRQRWVTHLDVDDAAVDRAVAAVGAFFG